MKRYTVWMNVEETWKIWFDAENMDEAKTIVAKLQDGDIDPDDIEGYGDVNKGIDTLYDVNSLEEFEWGEE